MWEHKKIIDLLIFISTITGVLYLIGKACRKMASTESTRPVA
jgi:hypothetical protein